MNVVVVDAKISFCYSGRKKKTFFLWHFTRNFSFTLSSSSWWLLFRFFWLSNYISFLRFPILSFDLKRKYIFIFLWQFFDRILWMFSFLVLVRIKIESKFIIIDKISRKWYQLFFQTEIQLCCCFLCWPFPFLFLCLLFHDETKKTIGNFLGNFFPWKLFCRKYKIY